MKRANEFRIGLWTLITIIVLIVGIKFLKGQLHTSTPYYMISENVERVAESSHVKINGYKVGFVHSLDYDYESGKTIVELYLDPALKVPVNSTATIIPDLLGTSNIKLELGDAKEYLQSGDTLRGGEIQPGLLDAAGPMISTVSNLIPKVDTLLTGLNQIVNESKLQESLLEVNVLANRLQTTIGELNRQLPGILNHVNHATTNLDSLSQELSEAEIGAIMAKASAAVDSLNTLLSSLNSAEGTAGKLIHNADLHNQLESTIADMDSLINDIKENPKRYINIKVFGK